MDKYLSTTELAKLLGVSRVAVFNKIKKGDVPAVKVGRNYIIKRADIFVGDTNVTKKTKKNIAGAISKVVDDYSQTLQLLAKE